MSEVPNVTSKLRSIEPFRMNGFTLAEVFVSSIGLPHALAMQFDTEDGGEASVTLTAREAHDLMLWLQCALGLSGASTHETPAPLTDEEKTKVGRSQGELAVLAKDGRTYNIRRVAGQALEVITLLMKPHYAQKASAESDADFCKHCAWWHERKQSCPECGSQPLSLTKNGKSESGKP